MKQASAAPEPAEPEAAPPIQRRHIGISTIFVGLMTLAALFLASVPARERHFFSGLHRYSHGWPLVFIDRQADDWHQPISAWQFDDGLIFWSPAALVVDLACAAAIISGHLLMPLCLGGSVPLRVQARTAPRPPAHTQKDPATAAR